MSDDNANEAQETAGNEKIDPFFSKPENLEIIKQACSKLEKMAMPDESDSFDENQRFIIIKLKQILKHIRDNTEVYDKLCQFNIGWIGQDFLAFLREIIQENEIKKHRLELIFAMAYRFICEFELSMPESPHNIAIVKENIDQHLNSFDDMERSQIIYANSIMPVNILKQLFHHKNIQSIALFEKNISDAQKRMNEWRTELEKREKNVTKLKDTLDEYKIAFNFVGLYDGFNKLSEDKNREKNRLIIFLVLMGVLVLSPLVSEIHYIILCRETAIKYKDIFVFAIFPLITFELILIYFFRIVLVNYKSVKALLIQIELRKTLCQFIQDYTIYSKEIKEKDSSSLEKFENLIFSGLVANEENLPSTFDGIEQLANLVKSIRKD